jgi:Dockerin type I domain
VLGNQAGLDIAFYENGPWGGIEYRLDALRNGQVVASDSFTISDLGGRDNATYETLAVGGATFDSLHLYAFLDGQYTAPRGMIDDLSIIAAPANCPGDVNGDNIVNLTDLATLLTNFGTPSGATREMGDLDADGDVDLTDLATLLTNFGTTCP